MHVLITGTSSGLGAALSEMFNSNDYDVTGTTHSLEDVEPGHQLLYDANDPQAAGKLVVSMAAMGIRQRGPVDLLINNAGINGIRNFTELRLEFMERLMRVNCHAPVLLVRELLTTQWFSETPAVINIVSDAAWRPMRHSEAYNTSKAALDMATRQMARELTKTHDMVIVGVRPGKMAGTGMSRYIDKQVCDLREWTPEEAATYYATNSVTGKEADPDHVARFIFDMFENPLFRTMSGACLDLVG